MNLLFTIDDESLPKIKRTLVLLSSLQIIATTYGIQLDLSWGMFEVRETHSQYVNLTAILSPVIAYLMVRTHLVARWSLRLVAEDSFAQSKELAQVSNAINTFLTWTEDLKVKPEQLPERTLFEVDKFEQHIRDGQTTAKNFASKVERTIGEIDKMLLAHENESLGGYKRSVEQAKKYASDFRDLLEQFHENGRKLAQAAKTFNEQQNTVNSPRLRRALVSVMKATQSMETSLVEAKRRKDRDQLVWHVYVPLAYGFVSICYAASHFFGYLPKIS